MSEYRFRYTHETSRVNPRPRPGSERQRGDGRRSPVGGRPHAGFRDGHRPGTVFRAYRRPVSVEDEPGKRPGHLPHGRRLRAGVDRKAVEASHEMQPVLLVVTDELRVTTGNVDQPGTPGGGS